MLNIIANCIGSGKVPKFVGLLDLYPSASVAYSLRRLSGTYIGSAIRVRRASDNAEQNIGFDALGNLDTTALTTFVNEDIVLLNDDFSSSTGWILATGVTISGGLLNFSASNGTATAYKSLSAQPSSQIRVTYTISNYVSGNILFLNFGGGGSGTSRSSNGTFVDTITTVTGNANWGFNTTTFTGSIDNLQIEVLTSNGFVTTWYDQSGNNYNSAQTTATNQPQIVSSGNVLILNTKPCIKFNGSTNLLDLPSGLANVFQGQGKAISSFNVNTYPTTTSQTLFILSNNANNDDYYYSGSSTGLGKYRFTARGAGGLLKQYQSINNFTIGNQYLKVDILNLESAGVQLGSSWVNNVLDINSQDYATASKTLNQGAIGALKRIVTAGYYNGNHQELIIYPTEQTSNRVDIESNINSYYGIY